MMSVDRRKVEDWLARCRWLATTKLDDRTRARLDRLIHTLEQDLELEEDELNGFRSAVLAVRRRARSTARISVCRDRGLDGFRAGAAGPSCGFFSVGVTVAPAAAAD